MGKNKAGIKEAQRHAWREQRRQRKHIRHNTAANQEKHRRDWRPLEPDEYGVVADRRIMPRDEAGRRQLTETLGARPLDAAVDDATWVAMAVNSPFALGTITAIGPGVCRVSLDGESLLCELRGVLTAETTGLSNAIAVGDRVLVQPLEAGRGVVEDVLPRRSGLARQHPFYSHLQQVIAANVDQLLIIASWREPHIWPALIDEYLIAAARNNLDAVICINKIDLALDAREVLRLVQPYIELGHRVLLTSAPAGLGLEALRRVLVGQTTVLAGLSGVGKSTLIAAVDPRLDLRTNTVSEWSGEGRHTTTQATLLPLTGGGYVIDTPGIRELGLVGLCRSDLIAFYPDIAAAAVHCRFSDCTHSHEPGCAVKKAMTEGSLTEWRLDNYHKLFEQLPA